MIGYSGGHPSGVWRVTTDATVSERYSFGTGEGLGGELVTPVLKGDRGFAELKKVCDALNTINELRINSDCGIHVHISHPDLDVETAKKVALRYGEYSSQINGFLPQSRRNNRWCQNVARFKRWIEGDNSTTFEELGRRYPDKYVSVNLRSLRKHKTIEFRQHSGSTDYTKISNWVKFLMGFIQASEGFSAQSRPTRRNKKAYGEVRDAVAQHGYELRYAGQGYKLFDTQNALVEKLSFNDLESFYVEGSSTREMTSDFQAWLASHFGETQDQPDTLFSNVPQTTQDFLNSRTAHFSNQTA